MERKSIKHLSKLLTLLFFFLTITALGTRAQQPPETSSAAQGPESPHPKVDNPQPKADSPADSKNGDVVGNSKLERETGTVNDRIMDVLPNYGTVEGTHATPALNTGQKFRLATAGVFDWAAYPFNAALAGIGQAKNDPKQWGQGWGAYGKRYGANFADNSIGTYMTTAIFPSLLHEDPRYYQMGQGSFKKRFFYALDRLFVTRTDSGKNRFNYSESVGNAAAAALSNIYHPSDDRTASRNASTFGFLILYDGISNELKEFWPDIRRKVFHQKNPHSDLPN